MHRDQITHCLCISSSSASGGSPRNMVITGSIDGHIKFWSISSLTESKTGVKEAGVMSVASLEHIKTFKAHAALLTSLIASADGALLLSASEDGTTKIFDLALLDVLAVHRWEAPVLHACWTMKSTTLEIPQYLCVFGSNEHSQKIIIVKGIQEAKRVNVVFPGSIARIAYNPVYDALIIVDGSSLIHLCKIQTSTAAEDSSDGENALVIPLFPDLKPEGTHLGDMVEDTAPESGSITVSPNGEFFSLLTTKSPPLMDSVFLRVYRMATGKLFRKYDESDHIYQRLFHKDQRAIEEGLLEAEDVMSAENFETRLGALSRAASLRNCVFDESGNFLSFSTPFGIKIINLVTNKTVSYLGKLENVTFGPACLFQGRGKHVTLEIAAAIAAGETATERAGEALAPIMLVASGLGTTRFYMFTREDPEDLSRRDIFNEDIITPEEQNEVQVSKKTKNKRLPNAVIIRTTLGDIHMELFGDLVPLAVENFTTLAKNGYYDNLIFHRVIRNFMIQTGDPLGDGTGGESCWGGHFQDEIHPTLRHNFPFTVSMANAGKNTNGSQFFITTVPCPWLDDKHTVFGRVIRGQDVVSAVEKVEIGPLDRPKKEIKILQIEILQ